MEPGYNPTLDQLRADLEAAPLTAEQAKRALLCIIDRLKEERDGAEDNPAEAYANIVDAIGWDEIPAVIVEARDNEQKSREEPIGVEHDKHTTVERAGPALLAAAKQVLAWEPATGGREAKCWKALRAAVDRAEGGCGGWVLIDVNGSGLHEIERDDNDGDIFDTDEEALAYVRWLASTGDYDAAMALQKHDADSEKLAAYRAAAEVSA